MNAMATVLILSMFALPIAAAIIIVICIIGDIKSHKEMKRFETAIGLCERAHGWDFTKRLLDRCSRDELPVINRIELLEHFAGVKNIHIAIAERTCRV